MEDFVIGWLVFWFWVGVGVGVVALPWIGYFTLRWVMRGQ